MKKIQCCFGLLTTLILLTYSSINANDFASFKLSGTTIQTKATENTNPYFVKKSAPPEKRFSDAKILPNTRILVYYENVLIDKIVSDQNGEFQLNDLRNGDYLILAQNDQNELSGIISFSLTSEKAREENLQLLLTKDSTLNDFFRQKWNDQPIMRSQMPLDPENVEMAEMPEMVQPQMQENDQPVAHVFRHHADYNNYNDYDRRYLGVASGHHCLGTWLAAGAITAAVVALAVDDDDEPVSPTK